MRPFDAIIFDLDGAICSTEQYHYQAWKATADSIGVYFDREINKRLWGVSRMDSLDIVLEQYPGVLSQAEKEELAGQKNELYKQLLAQMTPADLSGTVKEMLETLERRGYRLAIASCSKNAPLTLRQIGLEDFFDAVSDGNKTVRSIPDPEVYLNAAQMLCADPGRCLVVGKAVSGAKAAHAGGMKAACLGNAAKEQVGDYNIKSVQQLLDIL